MKAEPYYCAKRTDGGIVSYQITHDTTILGWLPTWEAAQEFANDHANGNLPNVRVQAEAKQPG